MASKKKDAHGDPHAADGDPSITSRLPFEPVPTRQKPPKKATPAPAAPSVGTSPASKKGVSRIPDVVNRRMVRRAALFCGVPTFLSLLTFAVSYVVITNHLLQLPTAAVLLVSLGFFGVGVLGLSYGPLSAAWDEDRLGTAFGWEEFKLNFGRLRESWRNAKAAQDETNSRPSA